MSDEPKKEAIPLSAVEREVRDLVRLLSHPEPDSAFRQRLRQEFVTGTLEEAGTKRKPLLRRPWVAPRS